MAQKILSGIGVSDGIVIGTTHIFSHAEFSEKNGSIPAEAVESEVLRFQAAADAAYAEINALVEKSALILGEEKIGVLKGQAGILKDPAYSPEIVKLIRKQLLSSEEAVRQITEKFAAVFESMKSGYMRERSADVRDAGSRLIDCLSGRKSGLAGIDRPVILISDDLSPSDTIQLDRKFVLGFATQRGGKTSHTSIFAKSLGIPAVVGASGLLDTAKENGSVILDGSRGVCIFDPDPETEAEYRRKLESENEGRMLLRNYVGVDASTGDGKRIQVSANIGSGTDAEYALTMGAEGSGLFRTEQIFLSRQSIPDEEEQVALYRKIAEIFHRKEVVVRTLDIGGDKALDYLSIGKEENPFLGFRAIRFCLERRDIFLTQLRAILRASAYGKLAIMFPMISGYKELEEAKACLTEAKAQLHAENLAFDETIRTGIMIEIPSAAVMADLLAEEVDFFSIGTNDLTQYTLAVDRGNEKVSYLYDYFNPALLRLIRMVSNAAHAHAIPVGMCGDMAGNPLAAPLLVGLHLDELSMPAGTMPRIKYALSTLDSKDCEALAASAEKCKSPAEVEALLNAFKRKNAASTN